MSNLQLIKQENFGDAQFDFYQNDNNEIWFTRDQLGRGLEYAYPNDSIRKIHERHADRLNRFSVSVKLTGADGKQYDTTVYSAKGAYEICRWSNQPKANALYDWIYDVLEDIRRHGLYATDELLNDPDLAIKAFQAIKDEREKNKKLEAEKRLLESKIEQDKPKVNFANIVGDTSKLITMSQMAKILCDKYFPIGRNRLFERLRDKKIIMQSNEPYQKYVDAGYFVVRDVIKNDLAFPQTLITGKGQQFIIDCFKDEIDETRKLDSCERKIRVD